MHAVEWCRDGISTGGGAGAREYKNRRQVKGKQGSWCWHAGTIEEGRWWGVQAWETGSRELVVGRQGPHN